MTQFYNPISAPGFVGNGSSLTYTVATLTSSAASTADLIYVDTTAGDVTVTIAADTVGLAKTVKKIVASNTAYVQLSIGGTPGTPLEITGLSGIHFLTDGTSTLTY